MGLGEIRIFASLRNCEDGYTFMDDTLPGGPRERTVEFHAPFDKCDREEDYREAWAFFEKAKRENRL